MRQQRGDFLIVFPHPRFGVFRRRACKRTPDGAHNHLMPLLHERGNLRRFGGDFLLPALRLLLVFFPLGGIFRQHLSQDAVIHGSFSPPQSDRRIRR